MKIYTYNNFNNNSNNLKSYLTNNAKKAFPWLFSSSYSNTRDFINEYYGPLAKTNFTTSRNNVCYNCPFAKSVNKSKYDLDDLDSAIYKLQNYRNNHDVDDYDYSLFGVPVKVYQNFIQIGYTIIPKDKYGHLMIVAIPKEERTTIIDIITKIELYTN